MIPHFMKDDMDFQTKFYNNILYYTGFTTGNREQFVKFYKFSLNSIRDNTQISCLFFYMSIDKAVYSIFEIICSIYARLYVLIFNIWIFLKRCICFLIYILVDREEPVGYNILLADQKRGMLFF